MSEKKPKNPVTEKGYHRVIRGGTWYAAPDGLRSSRRYFNNPSSRAYYLGFRIARTKK